MTVSIYCALVNGWGVRYRAVHHDDEGNGWQIHVGRVSVMGQPHDESADLEFTDFIEKLAFLIDHSANDAERVMGAEDLVKELIRGACSWLTPDKRQPSDEHYARHSLYRDPQDRFELLALVWKPGQCTSLHDHDGTWGVEAVLEGQIEVTNYFIVEEHADQTVRLAHTGAFTIGRLSTGRILPPADCHILKAHGDETAITLHVYGKQLRKFKVFEQSEDSDLYVVRDYYVDYVSPQ